MFKVNDDKQEMVEALLKRCAKLERGEVLTHEEIARTIKVRHGTPEYYDICQSLKTKVQSEMGVTLWAVYREGYQLLTHDDQIHQVPVRHTQRASRSMNRAFRSVKATPDAELNDHQRQGKSIQLECIRVAKRTLRSQLQAQSVAGNPAPTSPRPPQFA